VPSGLGGSPPGKSTCSTTAAPPSPPPGSALLRPGWRELGPSTPPEARRRGYGTAVSAAATAAAMAGGAEHVALSTDLANPTSNSIYQAIGYRPDHDADERSFQRP
jgi:RimJ/RimL family protein N-acetyltransferase